MGNGNHATNIADARAGSHQRIDRIGHLISITAQIGQRRRPLQQTRQKERAIALAAQNIGMGDETNHAIVINQRQMVDPAFEHGQQALEGQRISRNRRRWGAHHLPHQRRIGQAFSEHPIAQIAVGNNAGRKLINNQ